MINTSLLKAAFYKPSDEFVGVPNLPTKSLTKECQINANHCEQYNRLVNWKLGIASVIHPNYLQVLTLPMQLEMMTTQPFPFKAMGLVHIANSIEVKRLPEQNAKITLQTSFAGLEKHKKGWVFALLNEGFVDGEIAISGTSFYLSRQNHSLAEQDVNSSNATGDIQMPRFSTLIDGVNYTEAVLFPLGIGRKYARNSGDFNPIHLTRWTAKLMGFKQAIAHGMYSKALCLSQVLKRENSIGETCPSQSPMNISTQFMQPIYLPTYGELKVAYPNAKAIDNIEESAIENDHSEDNTNARTIVCSLSSKNRSKEREHLRTKIIIS